MVTKKKEKKQSFLASHYNTPFAVHYEKIRNHLRETTTNSAKIHSLAQKYEHSRINQIQLRFLHFNQHSMAFGHMICVIQHTKEKLKYTFINANIKVITTILKVNNDSLAIFD